MTFVSSALAVAAGTATLAVVAAAPTPVALIKYKAVINSKQILDATSLGGPKQETSQTSVTYFQMEIRDSAGGHVMNIVIDSLVPDSLVRAQVPTAIIDSAKGSVYRLFVDATGGVTETTITNGGVIATGFASSATQFLPRLKGALTAGNTWSDTTSASRTIPGGALKTNAVINYAVLEPTKVSAAFAGSQVGAQETPGGTAEIAGTTKGTATWEFGADKAISSLTRKDEGDLTITIAAAPGPLPLTQSQDVTVTRLP